MAGSFIVDGSVRYYCSRRVNWRYRDRETLEFTARSASRCPQRRWV